MQHFISQTTSRYLLTYQNYLKTFWGLFFFSKETLFLKISYKVTVFTNFRDMLNSLKIQLNLALHYITVKRCGLSVVLKSDSST